MMVEPKSNSDLILFTSQQISDLAKVLEYINEVYGGHGHIDITIKKGQVSAIGIAAEWRYELERKHE